MKRFLVVAFCLPILLLASCSKDTEINNDESNKLVGAWRHDFYDEDEPDYVLYIIYTFKKDGSGTCFEYDNGSIDSDNTPFFYSYDDNTSMLKIMWVKNGQVSHTEAGIINWINDVSFYCDHLADKGSIFVKQ